MTSWSALATMTRSTGSVSSAVRRSTVMRFVDAHDAGQCVRPAGDVADDADPVADDHALAAQLARAHRGDHVDAVAALADQQV